MQTNLDKPEIFSRLDPSNIYSRIEALPQQCAVAWQRALEFPLPRSYRDVDKVVVLGMGGSAIGGDLLRCLALDQGTLPVLVQRDYTLPAFVDERTLVIASSYSGNTEETLAAFVKALACPCKKLALTTGGKLKELAEQSSVPVLPIQYRSEPRSALAHSFMPLLAICQGLRVLPDQSAAVAEMAQVMQNLTGLIGRESPSGQNPAKQLAARLHGKTSLIYGAGFLSDVARRWKTQINENSKAWAFYDTLPELNHNSVVGYEFPPEATQSAFAVVLRAGSLNRRIQKRCDLTCEILSRAGVGSQTVEATGQGCLSQMMGLVLLGDYVSYYLAMLYGVDPAPVLVIDNLKKRLAEG